VAIEVFAQKGFEGTSMEDIAEAAGVTKPVLYQHFRSKRSLFAGLLEDVGAEMLEALDAALAAAGGPHRQVEAGFTAYFRFVADHGSAFRLLFGSGAQRDQEFAEVVTRVEEAIADEVSSFIDADIDPSHRRLLARAVVGMAEGASKSLVLGPPGGEARPPAERLELLGAGDGDARARDPAADPERMARRLADLAWAGLRGVRRD
jgi:AcrR family transcriptional regulator